MYHPRKAISKSWCGLYQFIPLYTVLYHIISVYITLYRFVPLYTIFGPGARRSISVLNGLLIQLLSVASPTVLRKFAENKANFAEKLRRTAGETLGNSWETVGNELGVLYGKRLTVAEVDYVIKLTDR